MTPIPLAVPTLTLLLGALVLSLLGKIPRGPILCIVGASVSGLALVVLWRLALNTPSDWVLASWRPLLLFGTPLAFGIRAGDVILASTLVGTVLLSFVAGCSSSRLLIPANLTLTLAAAGAGIVALFATSLVALVAAWVVTDVLLAVVVMRYGQAGVRRAGLALMSSILATAALWAAPLLAQSEGMSGFIDLAHFSGPSATLLQIAVILRLGLVPFHLWRPIDLDIELPQLIPLIVIPTLLGFDLLTYLPALTAGLPTALFMLAAVTVLVGGFVAWSESEERPSLAGVMVAETGMAVLSVANAGQQAVAVAVAAAVAWALSIAVFSLTPGWSGRRFWRGIPSLLALLSLLGLPPLLGFVVRFTAYSGFDAGLVALGVALIGESFVIASLVRLWYWAEPRPFPQQRLSEGVYLVIFALSALVLVFFGLFPRAFAGTIQNATLQDLGVIVQSGNVAGWAGWALPLVAGVTLFFLGEGLRQRLEGGWRGLGALLRLEWVYGLFYVALRGVVSLVRGVSSVVEGEGALLWTMIVLLIILIFLTGNGVGPLGS
jgi:hypothetical protein